MTETQKTGAEKSDRPSRCKAVSEARSKEIGILMFKNATLMNTLSELRELLANPHQRSHADLHQNVGNALDLIETMLSDPWIDRRTK
ncbi:hypothetical protein JJJ17_14675 [Paracoccus caeni]|uniref:Uncharacterized protein n=1 Tax=Paracoccus caeni TaxID=657651 RepID=A0A934W195_9RHOB|nr:hypothetical protein [Paracoccus caeni]MBK4217173.1 hypothetical protein [Paracoccus caeni]